MLRSSPRPTAVGNYVDRAAIHDEPLNGFGAVVPARFAIRRCDGFHDMGGKGGCPGHGLPPCAAGPRAPIGISLIGVRISGQTYPIIGSIEGPSCGLRRGVLPDYRGRLARISGWAMRFQDRRGLRLVVATSGCCGGRRHVQLTLARVDWLSTYTRTGLARTSRLAGFSRSCPLRVIRISPLPAYLSSASHGAASCCRTLRGLRCCCRCTSLPCPRSSALAFSERVTKVRAVDHVGCTGSIQNSD